MTGRARGLIIAALHVALVSGLGVKLLVDRAVRPRAWVEVAPYDPDLPIRGRYVRLQAKTIPRDFPASGPELEWDEARLSVEDGQLIATRSESGERVRVRIENGAPVVVLDTPLAYFIPEHVADPSTTPGLVVEVTLPRKGPPRPIRLGIREGDRITPLEL